MKYKDWIPLLVTVILSGCSPSKKPPGPLVCHVGGTMHPVFEEQAGIYEAETGHKIEINSAGFGELLANI